ncbi:hypothetical protein S7711_10319, partial [Stachybotrys chartarum IBT 7711]
MDKKAFTSELEKRLPPRRRPRTKTALDNYVEEIVAALTQAIDVSVPTSTPCSKAKAGWNEECSKMLAETKRLRRIYSATHTEEAWEAYRVARNKKGKTIKKALRKMHRDTIETAAESPEKLWRVAKWARSRESQVSELTPVIKDPVTAQEATTPKGKAKLFRDVFFLNPPEADLGDMDGATYPEQIKLPKITIDEVEDTILTTASNKAPGPDGITNRALQAGVTHIKEHLTRIFNASLDLGYCPQHFRSSTTV